MAKAEALFLLIKSLTAGEKALVRQVDKAQAGYLALFDFMSRQQEYDERKAKKKLTQLGIDINFAYAKNYLTKHILRVLREHNDTGQYTGTRQLQEIELLMQRRIYDLAEKLLAKARQKALAEERWHDFLQLSDTEMALLVGASGDLDESLRAIDGLNAERRRARENLQNLGEFEDLYYRYRPILKRKQNARNEWDLQLVQAFAQDSLLSSPLQAKSIRAQRIYYLCHALIQGYRGDFQGAREALDGSLQLYAAHSFLRDDYPEAYLTDLWRLGGHQLHQGDHAAVEQTLALLKSEREGRGLASSEIFEKHSRLLLSYAITTQRYALVADELPAIASGLEAHAATIPWTSLSVLILLLGRLQFEQGHLKEARRHLNKILDHPERGQREDITSLARIMLIFIYFEEGDGDLTEASSRATRKYLQRRDALYQSERRILRFMEQNSFTQKGAASKVALQALYTDLQAIFQDPLEANILLYFDILGWLQRKIQG